MKIGIITDTHDRQQTLVKATDVFVEHNVDYILHAGDLIAPFMINILDEFNGKTVFVWGNNEGEVEGITKKMEQIDAIELSGDVYEGELDGLKIFMNHYPLITEKAAKSGDYDLCIHGHTHEHREEKFNDTLLVNPGTLFGRISGTVTFMIFDTQSRELDLVTVE